MYDFFSLFLGVQSALEVGPTSYETPCIYIIFFFFFFFFCENKFAPELCLLRAIASRNKNLVNWRNSAPRTRFHCESFPEFHSEKRTVLPVAMPRIVTYSENRAFERFVRFRLNKPMLLFFLDFLPLFEYY